MTQFPGIDLLTGVLVDNFTVVDILRVELCWPAAPLSLDGAPAGERH